MASDTSGTEPRQRRVRGGLDDVDTGGVPPVFDEDKLANLRCALDEDELRSVLACIPFEAVKILNQIKAAVGAGDLDAVRRGAHSLKGMATNFGARRLAVAAREIELEAPTIEAVSDRLAELEAIVDATRQWLARLFDDMPGASRTDTTAA